MTNDEVKCLIEKLQIPQSKFFILTMSSDKRITSLSCTYEPHLDDIWYVSMIKVVCQPHSPFYILRSDVLISFSLPNLTDCKRRSYRSYSLSSLCSFHFSMFGLRLIQSHDRNWPRDFQRIIYVLRKKG